MLQTYEDNKLQKENKQKDLNSKKVFYKKSEDIISNNGIKQMVINNVLPLLNDNIELTLKDLDINFNVRIDSNFDCVITSFGEEINVKTLSTGERARVDISIVISLIKLIKLQFPSLNVMFLDEIFSSIDLQSINSMIEIIKVLSSTLDLNIFLVSHTSVDETLFDKKIILTKVNTFSELTIENLK
jgi:DNA repair exonuclease SbcCD ATPase subunit